MSITSAPIIYSVFKHKIGERKDLSIEISAEWIRRNHERFSHATEHLTPRPIYHSEISLDPLSNIEVASKLLAANIHPVISGITSIDDLKIAIDAGVKTGISPHIEKVLLKAAQERNFNLIPEGCNVQDFILLSQIIGELNYKLDEVKVMPFSGEYYSPQDLGDLLKTLYPKEYSERSFVNNCSSGTVHSPTDFIAAYMTGRNPIQLNSLNGGQGLSTIREIAKLPLAKERFISANGGIVSNDIPALHRNGINGFGLSEPFKVNSLDKVRSGNWEEADRQLDLLIQRVSSLYAEV